MVDFDHFFNLCVTICVRFGQLRKQVSSVTAGVQVGQSNVILYVPLSFASSGIDRGGKNWPIWSRDLEMWVCQNLLEVLFA